jgi:hypothetical protein
MLNIFDAQFRKFINTVRDSNPLYRVGTIPRLTSVHASSDTVRMQRRSIITSITLTPAEHQSVKQFAIGQGLSVSEVLRQALVFCGVLQK